MERYFLCYLTALTLLASIAESKAGPPFGTPRRPGGVGYSEYHHQPYYYRRYNYGPVSHGPVSRPHGHPSHYRPH